MRLLWNGWGLMITTALNAIAFEIYWNVPSYNCRKLFNPDEHGITMNANHEFQGSKIVIFYERDLGYYPYCEDQDVKNATTCTKPKYGGVPQATNLTAHLEKLARDVVIKIPDPEFDGLAIIDYERWRPLFDANWSSRKIYVKYSIDLVTKTYPELGKDTLTYMARYLYDYHAKKFLLATINAARSLRPKAKWTFWDFPLCDYKLKSNQKKCSPFFPIINEQLLWLFNASDVIVPHIYFYAPLSVLDRQRYVNARISEAEEIVKKLHPKKLDIYAYAKFEYNVYLPNDDFENNYYTKVDVCNSLKYPMEMGVKGVILWSSSRRMNERCKSLANYFNSTFGPFAGAVKKKAIKCSQKYCNGVGECVAKDRSPQGKCELAVVPEVECLCPETYYGPKCEHRSSPVTQPIKPLKKTDVSALNTIRPSLTLISALSHLTQVYK